MCKKCKFATSFFIIFNSMQSKQKQSVLRMSACVHAWSSGGTDDCCRQGISDGDSEPVDEGRDACGGGVDADWRWRRLLRWNHRDTMDDRWRWNDGSNLSNFGRFLAIFLNFGHFFQNSNI